MMPDYVRFAPGGWWLPEFTSATYRLRRMAGEYTFVMTKFATARCFDNGNVHIWGAL